MDLAQLIATATAATIHDLEQPRVQQMPVWPGHRPGYSYVLHKRHEDTYNPDQDGPRTSASGLLNMKEHSGTHIDAISHQAYDLHLCGDIPISPANEQFDGFKVYGVETIPPILRRGVLLDVAAAYGVARLAEGYGITTEDLELCVAQQQSTVRPGDVLLVRTGYGTLWQMEEPYLKAAGVGIAANRWVAERGVYAVGIDNMTWDLPGPRDPESGASLHGHYYLLAKRGIYIIENLNLESLSAARCYTFLFVGIPLKFVGATGSPIRPLALAI